MEIKSLLSIFHMHNIEIPTPLQGNSFPMASRKACSWNSAPGLGLPSAQSPRSVSGHLCPGSPCGCCRWASAGTDRAASTSSCRRHRTPQSPACPGCHLCQPPAAHSSETVRNQLPAPISNKQTPAWEWSTGRKCRLKLPDVAAGTDWSISLVTGILCTALNLSHGYISAGAKKQLWRF